VYLSSEFLFPHLGFSLFSVYFPAKKKKKFSKISNSFSCCFCGSPGVEISDSVSDSFVSEILFGLWFSELVLASPQLQSSQQPVR
jgi:hypothetical protein